MTGSHQKDRHMRKLSKLHGKVKALDGKNIEQKVIDEETLLSMAVQGYASKVLQDAVARICSTMKGAQSWGSEEGFVRVGLNKVSVERPRLRGKDGEIEIEEYKKMQSPTQFTEAVRRAMMGGLATRSFEKVGRAIGAHKGLSKSVVSRVSKSFAEDFKKLMEQDCADVVACYIDGIYFTDEICVVAVLGVGRFGGKRLLGLWAGSTETAELMKTVMQDLKSRNLNPKLFVIDGSKALRSSIDKHFPWVAVQRCQVHKKRNIFAHLGDSHHAWANIEMTRIFKADSYAEGYRLGKVFEKELVKINITASRSWAEAFPEVITVLQVKDPDLRRVLSSTNPIESIFSAIRGITIRVKRWRNASHALYWTAGGYYRIHPNLNKIRGYKSLSELDGVKKVDEKELQIAA